MINYVNFDGAFDKRQIKVGMAAFVSQKKRNYRIDQKKMCAKWKITQYEDNDDDHDHDGDDEEEEEESKNVS